MASKIDMINSGLVLCGDKPLNSLTEARRAAVVANQLYDSILAAEISKHRWGFCRTLLQLNQLVDAPLLDQFRYAYQLPADLIVEVRLVPNEYEYKRYGKVIYSNQPSVMLDYIAQPLEKDFPPYFERLFTYALARDFSVSIRDELNHLQAMEARYIAEARNARFQDSQAYPQEAFQDQPFTTVRY